MAKNKSNDQREIRELVSYMQLRLEIILNKWRTVCLEDPNLDKKDFSREEFMDQVPVLFSILIQRLLHKSETLNPVTVASEHGLHRWQAGYTLHDLIIEMEHLFWILLDEVKAYNLNNPEFSAIAISQAYHEIFRIYSESSRGSAFYYDQLRQTNAAEQAASLQHALDQLQQLSKQRNEHLRHSSHDLRSSFSTLMVASQMLEMPSSEEEKVELTEMLNKNLSSMRDMLLQLTDYARIEAGQETVELKEFDAAALIKDTVKLAQPLAERRKLFLQSEGSKQLPVKSDPVKVQRILQNLLHNALKYTHQGGIYVTWARENETRWILSIQDTGPGFPENSPAALLVEQLKPPLHTSASNQGILLQEPPSVEMINNESSSHLKESEGLGLFIVKKICELMNANMDIESSPGHGTLVRIRFSS